MDKSIWLSVLQTKLNENDELFYKYSKHGMQFYLFGSSKQELHPRDIDILILYSIHDMTEAQNIRSDTVRYLESFVNIPIDCILLSFEEDKQANFVEKEGAIRIFP